MKERRSFLVLAVAAVAMALAALFDMGTAGSSFLATGFTSNAVQRTPVKTFGRPLSASRGTLEADETGRGSRIVAYNLVKRGPYAKERREDLWKQFAVHKNGKRYSGMAGYTFRKAKEKVMKAMKNRYVARRQFKHIRRAQWIVRVNNNCKLHGVTYSRFIQNLKEKNININRKILSQLGVFDRSIFTNIMDIAMPWWPKSYAKKQGIPPRTSQELTEEDLKGMDDDVIPYIEALFPGLYTDECIRFNRKVVDNKYIQYVVDTGDPMAWRSMLPRSPDLANFNVPDHWYTTPNAEPEEISVEKLLPPEGWKMSEFLPAMKPYRGPFQAAEVKNLANLEKNGLPPPTKKTPVDRSSWFDKKPQSWL